MRIKPDDVEHISILSRLYITEEEKNIFGSQLSKILDYIENLNQLDTSGVNPTSHVLEIVNIMRNDVLEPSLPVDDALSNSPDRADNYYRVPKIIE